MSERKRKKKKNSVFKVIGIVFVTVITIALLTVGLYINYFFGGMDIDDPDESFTLRPQTPYTGDEDYDFDGFDETRDHYSGEPKFSWEPVTNKDIINILLIGADKRPEQDDPGRSDTMIIATLDMVHKKIKLTSIMRDTYVFLPAEGYMDSKINAAYYYGGPKFLLNTINANFNTSLSKYVVVDFDVFRKVIDIIGGVDIEMNKDEVDYFKKNLWSLGSVVTNMKVGVNHLNGAAALEYARLRAVGKWDYERTDRQRRLLIAVYEKVIKMKDTKVLAIAEEIRNHITTNLSPNEMINLIRVGFKLGEMEVKQLRIPYKNTFTEERRRGAQVLIPDIQKNAEIIRDFIYYDKY